MSERVPEYRMPYEDMVTEEAWAIASSKRAYEESGSRWEPWKLNLVTIKVADIISGKRPDLAIILPDEEDYYWARQRIDLRIEDQKYRFARLQRARIIYCELPTDQVYVNPSSIQLNASWNGMRDPLPVDEFFFLAGIPDNQLKSVFHWDPWNIPPAVKYQNHGFFGFAEGGRQRLTELIGKPIAFVYRRAMREKGRRAGSWDLSSKEIFYPAGLNLNNISQKS